MAVSSEFVEIRGDGVRILHKDGQTFTMARDPKTDEWFYSDNVLGKNILVRALQGLRLKITRGGRGGSNGESAEPNAQRLSRSLPDVPGAGEEWWQD